MIVSKSMLLVPLVTLLLGCNQAFTVKDFNRKVLEISVKNCENDLKNITFYAVNIDSSVSNSMEIGIGNDSGVVICYDIKNWSSDQIEVYFRTAFLDLGAESFEHSYCTNGSIENEDYVDCGFNGFWWFRPLEDRWLPIPPRNRF